MSLSILLRAATKSVAVSFLCLTPLLGWAGNAPSALRVTAEIAPGVYVIRHPDAADAFPQGNTTVVIGERSVLVVDTCYLPSSAREDIAQIRKWTQKPVRYLVNTHWHEDHVLGNSTYIDVFPDVEVIAHVETARQARGNFPQYLGNYPQRAERFNKLILAGKDDNGRAFLPGEIQELKTAVTGTAPVGVEFAKIVHRIDDLVPHTTFDSELDLDLGNRPVQLKFLGRGNTAGDIVAWLPKENIVVAGDLLDAPVPYLGGGFPREEVVTLRKLAALQPSIIVPGHGEVLHGTEHLNTVTDFIANIVDVVDRSMYDPAYNKTVEDMQKAVEAQVDIATWRKRLAGDNQDAIDLFDGFSLPGVIRAAYYQFKGR
jgi:cyclase